MKNLFKAIQITFNDTIINNSEYNKNYDREGFRQHMLPAVESNIARVERELDGFVRSYNLTWEREFTSYNNGTRTIYISFSTTVPTWLVEVLHEMLTSTTLTAVTYGSVKVDASFVASKNQK